MKAGLLRNPRVKLKEKYSEDCFGREVEDDFFEVKKALEELGYDTVVFEARNSLFEHLKDQKKDIDFVFNTCDEGFECDSHLEPHVVTMLELLRIPYTGSDYLTLGMCLDKGLTKRILMANKIPTPRFVYSSGENTVLSGLKFPLMIKPSKEDGSIGIREDSVVHDEESLKRKIREIEERYKQPAIIEEFIDGREFNVAIIGNGSPEVLPVSEIQFTGTTQICSYDAKWNVESPAYKTTVPVCPAPIPKKLENDIKKMALKAYKALNVKGYGRIDMRVANNKPFVIEVNPNPDISPDAGLVRSAKAAGYTYATLIKKIVEASYDNKRIG
jgi:D-alanine-D-alanine ligase